MAESRLTFLFDENSPLRLARSLHELGQEAFHASDVGLRSTPDELVIQYAGERGWLFVSADRGILHRPHERAALKKYQVGAFFLNDTLKGLCTISRTVYRHWPEMKRLARREARPFVFLVRERTITRIHRRTLG